MSRPGFIVGILFAACLTAATALGPRLDAAATSGQPSASLLETLMGDSRRLFAAHFLVKADAYFHSGVYPSIFEDAQGFEADHRALQAAEEAGAPASKNHAEEEPHAHADHDHAGHDHDHDHAESHKETAHKEPDWIDRFARHFEPTGHTHLDSSGPVTAQGAREILPWLKLAAELDPQRPDTYTLAAFWLRTRLGKVSEAEAFLREGLHTNPGDPTILFELGRATLEAKQDSSKARQLWEAALAKWREREAGKPEPDKLLLSQITVHLAKLEEGETRYGDALAYWEIARTVSPKPEVVDQRIAELRTRQQESASPQGGTIPPK